LLGKRGFLFSLTKILINAILKHLRKLNKKEEEMTEKLKEVVCDWCCGGSILDIGAGMFRDFDSDLSYGIPVCGGCGGLGKQIENDDFKARINRILELRFEYCPVDPSSAEVSVGIKIEKLEALIREVTELFRIYGKKGDKSFAEKIANGALQRTLDMLRKELAQDN
jgi:hypothetical protein